METNGDRLERAIVSSHMPVFDDPNYFPTESDQDLDWLRSLARLGHRAKKRAEKRGARPPDAPITEEELCARLSISREAVQRFRRDPADPIPCLKVGRRFLYHVAEVERWARRRAERARPPRRHPRRYA